MVSAGARAVLLAGVVAGATILGGITGAGIDFVLGTQGWWGVGVLGGLMIAGVIDARIVEGRARP
ncbi:MAG TPA: hypothetical protein VK821_11710 [Dehalococcoidia bacterium]|nr:hypothetical protein [Dehalococcoidia bacterium]